MPLMSPTDYVRNTVLWLPLTVVLLVAAGFMGSLMPVSKPRQRRTSPTILFVILLVTATLFALSEYLFGVTGLGVGYFVAAYAYWLVGFVRLFIKGDLRPWVLIIGIGG